MEISKKLKIIIIFLMTMVLILSGYIIYDKVLNNDLNKEENNNINNNDDTNSEKNIEYKDYQESQDGYVIEYKFTKNDNYKSTTNILNKFAIVSYKELNIDKQLLLIDEGKLYYSTNKTLYEN